MIDSRSLNRLANLRSHTFVLYLILFSIAPIVHADIYEYIDAEGIAHYSDAPNHEDYVLIIKAEEVHAESSQTKNTTSYALEQPILSPPQLMAHIEQSAQNNQVDRELIHAVMHVESAFKTKATSRKGAQGLMQLMPATAKRMGVTNAYDPAQNIEGGAKYLRQLLNLFNNDLTLAVAAYNAGENAVIKYGYHIPPYKETQAYVPKVMAVYNALVKQRKPVF